MGPIDAQKKKVHTITFGLVYVIQYFKESSGRKITCETVVNTYLFSYLIIHGVSLWNFSKVLIRLYATFNLRTKPSKPRVPQCLSPRQNWDPPPPLSQACVSPPEPKGGGGGHTVLRVRGCPNLDDWRKSLALCLLCAVSCHLCFLR